MAILSQLAVNDVRPDPEGFANGILQMVLNKLEVRKNDDLLVGRFDFGQYLDRFVDLGELIVGVGCKPALCGHSGRVCTEHDEPLNCPQSRPFAAHFAPTGDLSI